MILALRISHSMSFKPITMFLVMCCCQDLTGRMWGLDGMNHKGKMAGITMVFLSEMSMKCFPKYGTMIKPGKTLLAAPFGSVCHKTGGSQRFSTCNSTGGSTCLKMRRKREVCGAEQNCSWLCLAMCSLICNGTWSPLPQSSAVVGAAVQSPCVPFLPRGL